MACRCPWARLYPQDGRTVRLNRIEVISYDQLVDSVERPLDLVRAANSTSR
jgi:hypothetical protein